MGLVDSLSKLISEHGSAEVLQKHVALLKDQAIALERENAELKQRVSDLEAANRVLISAAQTNRRAAEFVEHRGVLFKKKPSGGYFEAVYCPHCKGPMGTGHPGFPYQCVRCKVIADFREWDVKHKIMAELAALGDDVNTVS